MDLGLFGFLRFSCCHYPVLIPVFSLNVPSLSILLPNLPHPRCVLVNNAAHITFPSSFSRQYWLPAASKTLTYCRQVDWSVSNQAFNKVLLIGFTEVGNPSLLYFLLYKFAFNMSESIKSDQGGMHAFIAHQHIILEIWTSILINLQYVSQYKSAKLYVSDYIGLSRPSNYFNDEMNCLIINHWSLWVHTQSLGLVYLTNLFLI